MRDKPQKRRNLQRYHKSLELTNNGTCVNTNGSASKAGGVSLQFNSDVQPISQNCLTTGDCGPKNISYGSLVIVLTGLNHVTMQTATAIMFWQVAKPLHQCSEVARISFASLNCAAVARIV